jgi:hypothetical protein
LWPLRAARTNQRDIHRDSLQIWNERNDIQIVIREDDLDDALIERARTFLDGKAIREEHLMSYISSESRSGPVVGGRLLRRALDMAERASWTTELIGKQEDWVKFWKGRRGGEQIPRVDFGRSVVVIATWPGMAADSLHLGPCGKYRHAVWVGAWEGKIDGIGYVMGVFPRSGIKDIEGKQLPR